MLDKEIILTLKAEYAFAQVKAGVEQQRLERIQAEFEEAQGDYAYWSDRTEALNVLLAQDNPAPVVQFKTFGEE